MHQECDWPDCASRGERGLHGRNYCRRHEKLALRAKVSSIPPQLGPHGCPSDHRWRNCFARLVEHVDQVFQDYSLTKAKIETRAHSFSVSRETVEFTIERHPVGRVAQQRWRFDLAELKLELLSERDLESKYPWNSSGQCYDCPECGNGPLYVMPGRAKCCHCGFEELHEHSDPWRS